MSANNWRECPRCVKTAKDEVEKLQEEAAKAYGKVSREKWTAMTARATEAAEKESESTLREDWHLGVDDAGEFEVSYRCSCQNCRYEFRFKHKEQTVV